jgi:hypothetical protein
MSQIVDTLRNKVVPLKMAQSAVDCPRKSQTRDHYVHGLSAAVHGAPMRGQCIEIWGCVRCWTYLSIRDEVVGISSPETLYVFLSRQARSLFFVQILKLFRRKFLHRFGFKGFFRN